MMDIFTLFWIIRIWIMMLPLLQVEASNPDISSYRVVSADGMSVDMCNSDLKHLSYGTLQYPEYPDFMDKPHCSCNFSTVRDNSKVYLSLRVNLQTEKQQSGRHGCDAMLHVNQYDICPPASNKLLNMLVTHNEQLKVAFTNPNRMKSKFQISFSAQQMLKVECRASYISGVPPVLGVGENNPLEDPGVEPEKKKGTFTVAVVASILIGLAAIGLVVAAIIRWRCVVHDKKKHKKEALAKKLQQGDNMGFQPTPISSIFDVSSERSVPPHHVSFSSMIGVNRDMQPNEAPITGLGALAAHTEPYLPGSNGRPRPNGNLGMGPHDRRSQVPSHHSSFSSMLGVNMDHQPVEAPLTGLGALAAHTEPKRPPSEGPGQNANIGGGPHDNEAMSSPQTPQTPPQPRRPAPPLGSNPDINFPQYRGQWPPVQPNQSPQDMRPKSYPHSSQNGPSRYDPPYDVPGCPPKEVRPSSEVDGPYPPRTLPETRPPLSPEDYYQVPKSLHLPSKGKNKKTPKQLQVPRQQTAVTMPEVAMPHNMAMPEVIASPPYIKAPPEEVKAFTLPGDDIAFMDDEDEDSEDMYSRRVPSPPVQNGYHWEGSTDV